MKEMKIVKTIFLKAPPAHVWKFLTEPEKLAVWFHQGEGALEEGGDWALLTNSLGREGERVCWGKVLEIKPPSKLVHTFTHPFLKEVETTCSWTLEAAGDGTILTLEHAGWEKFEEDPFGMAANHDTGWDEHFARLRRVTN